MKVCTSNARSGQLPRAPCRRSHDSSLVASAAWQSRPRLAGDLPRAKPEEVGFSSERLRRIDETIQRHIDEHKSRAPSRWWRAGARSSTSRHMG